MSALPVRLAATGTRRARTRRETRIMFDKKEYMKKYNQEHYPQQKLWRKQHPEKLLARRERFRIKHPDYEKIRRERTREAMRVRIRKWTRENKEKKHAENVVKRKPFAEKCEICDSTNNLVKHHPDYSEPLIFVTLCASCHRYGHGGANKP